VGIYIPTGGWSFRGGGGLLLIDNVTFTPFISITLTRSIIDITRYLLKSNNINYINNLCALFIDFLSCDLHICNTPTNSFLKNNSLLQHEERISKGVSSKGNALTFTHFECFNLFAPFELNYWNN